MTLDSGEAIRAARELYDGFSGAIQSQVANRDVLVRDEEQFSALRVQHVNDLITDIGEVTLSSEDRIREAEDAYNALSESEAAQSQIIACWSRRGKPLTRWRPRRGSRWRSTTRGAASA